MLLKIVRINGVDFAAIPNVHAVKLEDFLTCCQRCSALAVNEEGEKFCSVALDFDCRTLGNDENFYYLRTLDTPHNRRILGLPNPESAKTPRAERGIKNKEGRK